MKTLNVKQGSDEWKDIRGKYRTASAAPAMMGVGKHSRNALLKLMVEGVEVEHSQFTEDVIFARGHEVEALARPIAEQIIGEELFPITGVCDDDYLLASFDGITMTGEVIWENKQWNESKAEKVRNQECPDEDFWQVVHQLKVSGAEKCIFTISDGTDAGTVALEIIPTPDDFKALMAGWQQFDKDLESYQPRESEPEAVGRAPDQLPALHIEVKGAVTASNLEQFKATALEVFRSINTDLQTDADFANADKTAKWCGEVETKLEAAKDHALAQTASIDDLFRAIDSIKEEARATRLKLERSVKARKDAIRSKMITESKGALLSHVESLNAALPYPIPSPNADFAGAIKGKRTVSSLRDACDDLLAQSKIEANELAERVRANAKIIEYSEHKQLFADAAQLCMKDLEHVEAVVKSRVAEHKAAEQRRLEAERERIRVEEAAKATAAEEAARKQDEPKVEVAAPRQTQNPNPQAGTNAPQRQGGQLNRPSDTEILSMIASYWRVHESKAHEWILAMDHKAVDKWIREESAA